MKKSMFLIALMLLGVCAPVNAQGDDGDDMYFTPSSSKKAAKTSKSKSSRLLTVKSGSDDASDEAPANYTGKDYSDAEVDAYNRRGRQGVGAQKDSVSGDTLYIGDGDEARQYADRYEDAYYPDDYYYSSRLARFHEPAVNIYLGYGYPYSWGWGWSYGWGDPFWWDSYYGWYDPWGWSWSGYYSWYGWGNPWNYGWAYWDRPWAPRGPRHTSAWNGGRYVAGHTDYSKWGSAGGRIWGGGRNYRGAIERNGSRGATAYSGSATRGFSTYNGGRNSSSSNMRTRTFGGSRSYSSSPSTSTRSMGGSSAPSRSFSGGGSSSPSMGTRSFGGGGGRSFGGGGGGGGRSFGGGRR